MPSVKLSVTVNQALEAKYDAGARGEIHSALDRWIEADARRGTKTIHVALDDARAMARHGAPAVSGSVRPESVKRSVDALCDKLSPDYLVLFGGPDVIPYFEVANPSHDPSFGDTDPTVTTDNPYACSRPFRAEDRTSYLVPDRVVGRLVDVPGDGDPTCLVASLATATDWVARPKADYDAAYAVCCDEWRDSGAECIQYVGVQGLLVSPPEADGADPSAARLASRLHLIKCHGAEIDPKFYGQQGSSYPTILSSGVLEPRVSPRTIVGAMCCYGAQVFSPEDPAVQPGGRWPIAAAYLRRGAYGVLGSTKIAWVGRSEMLCADWIVARWLRALRNGASIGRASVETKQEYLRMVQQQRGAPGIEDEKTLLEFVLLGDPAIQPVLPASQAVAAGARGIAAAAARGPVSPAALAERRQRRIVQSEVAAQIRRVLPTRSKATRAAQDRSADLFSVVRELAKGDVEQFGLAPEKVRVQKVSTTLAPSPAAGGPRRGVRAAAPARRDSFQYYWSGRRVVNGHTEIRLVRVETDAKGAVLGGSVVESA